MELTKLWGCLEHSICSVTLIAPGSKTSLLHGHRYLLFCRGRSILPCDWSLKWAKASFRLFCVFIGFSVWFRVRLCLPDLLQTMLLEVRLCTRNLLEEKKISGRSRLPVTLASGRAGGPSIVSSTSASRWALHPDSQSVWPVMQSVPGIPVPRRRDKEHRQPSRCSRFQRSCSPQSTRTGKILPYAVLVLNSQQFKQRQRSERSSWL